MYKTAVAAVALAGSMAVEAYRLQKRDGAGHGHGGGHDHGHSAPAAPSSGYDAPASGYSAPSAGYGAPAQSYGAPSDGYGAAAPSYGGGEVYGGYEEEDTFPDLTPVIIGILALIGLSLLFPTFVSLNTGRRKRSAAEEANPMVDMAERFNDIMYSVVKSEECVQRMVCELGGIAKDVGLQGSMYGKFLDILPMGSYSKYYKQFKSGKNCEKIQCGSF